MNDSIVLNKNTKVVTRKIGKDTLLIPMFEAKSTKQQCIYTLNNDAAALWDLIDGKTTLKSLKDTICRKYKPSARTLKQFQTCISDLKKIKAVL